jgi:hypothetical protein
VKLRDSIFPSLLYDYPVNTFYLQLIAHVLCPLSLAFSHNPSLPLSPFSPLSSLSYLPLHLPILPGVDSNFHRRLRHRRVGDDYRTALASSFECFHRYDDSDRYRFTAHLPASSTCNTRKMKSLSMHACMHACMHAHALALTSCWILYACANDEKGSAPSVQ